MLLELQKKRMKLKVCSPILNQVASVTDSEADEALLDPRASAEPEDIVSKIPANLKAGLASSKWKERKEVLDELLAVCSAPMRIKDASELGDVARSLAICIQKDANVACVVAAASCMEALAKGIMAPFGKYREGIVSHMLERLKERKASVTDVIGQALDAVFVTVSSYNHCSR